MATGTINTPGNPELDGKQIEVASLVSVRLELYFKSSRLATATGFVDVSPQGPVLVTNRHVFTGRHQLTRAPLDRRNALLPDEVAIWFRARSDFRLTVHRQPLFGDDLFPLWLEHPELGERADIASLPLIGVDSMSMFYPRQGYIDALPSESPVTLAPTTPVAIVGYPFGKHTDGFPVWTTGSIASEPNFDYDQLPVMLVDARTRIGQSGSPVLFHSHSGVVLTANGPQINTSSVSYFLGVYSGRITDDSDLGMVWRADSIDRLLSAGVASVSMDPEHRRCSTEPDGSA